MSSPAERSGLCPKREEKGTQVHNKQRYHSVILPEVLVRPSVSCNDKIVQKTNYKETQWQKPDQSGLMRNHNVEHRRKGTEKAYIPPHKQ